MGTAEKGFTLVETLIALLIMGVTTAAMIVLIGQNTRFIADAETRYYAGIAADNLLVDTLARPVVPEIGITERPVTIAGRAFVTELEITETTYSGIFAVTARVRPAVGDQLLVEVSSLKGQSQ